MQVAASLSARTKSPAMHIVISYSNDEAPTRDQMRADAGEVLAGLGLAKNQGAVIRHSDAGHVHMHLMVNRVGPDGRAVNDSNNYARTEATLRRIEARRGWKAVHGRHAPAADGQRMTGARVSRDPNQFQPPPGVRQALLTSKSWPELRAGLAHEGWKVEIVKRPGQKPGALLVGPAGERVASGRVDRAATFARLESRLGRRPRDLADQPEGRLISAGETPTAPHVRGRRGPDLRRPGGRRRKGGAEAEVKAAEERAVQTITGLMPTPLPRDSAAREGHRLPAAPHPASEGRSGEVPRASIGRSRANRSPTPAWSDRRPSQRRGSTAPHAITAWAGHKACPGCCDTPVPRPGSGRLPGQNRNGTQHHRRCCLAVDSDTKSIDKYLIFSCKIWKWRPRDDSNAQPSD